MKFDIVTIFPDMVRALLSEGVVGRASGHGGILDIEVHDLRSFTTDRHHTVDDVPYGGGPGMVMKPEPLARSVDDIRARRGNPDAVVLLSPQGRIFTQREAVRMSALSHVTLLCGRYEGVDERIRTGLCDDEISLGDFVLAGGELGPYRAACAGVLIHAAAARYSYRERGWFLAEDLLPSVSRVVDRDE